MPPTLLDTPRAHPSHAVAITLPAGTTLPQFVSLQGSLVTTAIVIAIAFGVLIYDYLHLFPHEIKLYQKSSKALWSSPASWAFILLRYSGILAIFPALFFTFVQRRYCQGILVSSQVGAVLVVASSGLIFCSRVTAMWGGHKAVYAVVGIMYVVMIGCWCAVVSQYRTETISPVPFGSNCHTRPSVSWTLLAPASSVAFDTVLLLLAAFKLPNTSASSSSSSSAEHTIHRDTMLCFLITAIANVIVLVIQALSPHYNHIKPTVLPISTLITVLMGTRVYLHHLTSFSFSFSFSFSQRQIHFEHILPMTMTSMRDNRPGDTYTSPSPSPGHGPAPVTPSHSSSASGGAPVPQDDGPKAYPIINLSSLDVTRPDTPFGSYDYDDTPKEMTHFPRRPVFTRETVVTVE